VNDIDPRLERLRSTLYTPGQLMALGRITELSALLELLLRQVLEQVMGLGQAAGEALFLGDRASSHVRRIKDMGKFADMPKWFTEDAVGWAIRVGNAVEARDDLLHRAPVMLSGDDEDAEPLAGWGRARRSHRPEAIDNDRLLELVDRLAALQAEAMHKLFWGEWEASIYDVERDGDDDGGTEGGPLEPPSRGGK
jgi:hypothetical protein